MDHVVASLADAVQMPVPIVWVLAHELGQHGDTRNGVEWDARFLDVQAGRDIDVEGLGLRGLGDVCFAGREGLVGSVGAVKGKGASVVDGNVDLDRVIEAGIQSEGSISILNC